MKKRNLRALLVEAQRELDQVDLPREADRRLRDRLFEKPAASSRSPRWVFAAVCVVVVAGVVGLQRSFATRTLDGLRVTASSADLEAVRRADRVIEISVGSFTLVDEATGDRLSVKAPATMIKERDGVRLVRGVAEFSVAKRRPGSSSARVLVSRGAIEVLGTRFTVVEQGDQGSVTLHEGEIRFHDEHGGSRALAPGERLEWPPPTLPEVVEAPAPAPAPIALPVAKSKRVQKPARSEPIVFRDPDDLLQQVDVLRSRGLFPEAARYLSHGLTTALRPATRERFSYELGSILTYQLDDPRACAHWRDHARRYPTGRYQTEVLQASTHAACEGGVR